MTEITRRYLHR